MICDVETTQAIINSYIWTKKNPCWIACTRASSNHFSQITWILSQDTILSFTESEKKLSRNIVKANQTINSKSES